MKTQIDVIEEHLLKEGPITSWEAFERYGVTRLSSHIFDLRKRCREIETTKKQVVNRYGQKTFVAEYRIVDRS